MASDRCHLGVLAYRHAPATLGHTPWTVFHHAREHAERLGLDAHHHHDEIRIELIDPERSRRRRARFATHPRYWTWFDPEFLQAYNAFFTDLEHWSTPGPRWKTTTLREGNHDGNTTDHVPNRTDPATPDLACARDGDRGGDRGCGEPRSPVVTHARTQRQLYTAALHHRTAPNSPVTCLRGAGAVTAAWRELTTDLTSTRARTGGRHR